MSKFNLLDEKWIKVVDKKSNQVVEVSLKEVFEHAHELKMLAGEMKTQDFAMLRLLLAVLHTVFSRFNANGEVYEFLEVDERYRQKEDVSEDDLEEYRDELMDTWKTLWKSGEFPKIVVEYLEKWRDRFYLFDEKYPFYQVTKEEMYNNIKEGKNPGITPIKTINRLISESNNKIALFSPKSDALNNKNNISNSESARWLVMFQGYTGQADKTKLKGEDYDVSKGWIYDIGGIYFEGDTLFETLLLNLALVHPTEELYTLSKENPCWELSGEEKIQESFLPIKNLACLYTNWSRAIYLSQVPDKKNSLDVHIVKMPNVEHNNNFLELMTIWRYNKTGPNKDTWTPKKHTFGQSLWRSFGLLPHHHDKNVPNVGIVSWYETILNLVQYKKITLKSVSMQDDGNATSWVPVNEIIDKLRLSNVLLFDDEEGGWTVRINDIIEETKSVIETQYKFFLKDIKEIRNYSNDGFVNNKIEELYSLIDEPFRNWIFDIDETSKKDESIFKWRKIFKKILIQSAQEILNQSNPRDLKGIKKEDKIKNVPMAYNTFEVKINSILG